MEYSHLALLLLVVGLALMAAEIFIPSGGVILTLALLSFAGSLWCAWNAWWISDRIIWWTYIMAMILLLPMTIGGALYLLPRTAFGRRILLEAPSIEEVTPYAEEEQHLSGMIGESGKTLTLLSPGGLVQVNGERMHCESEGMLIEPNEVVDIIAFKGNRLVVRKSESSSKTSDAPHSETSSSEKPPLDFDVPQS